MMKFRSFYSLAIMLLFTCSLSAQSAQVERAQRYMKELNYVGAIEILTKVISKKDDAAAKISLAECYRKVNDVANAEFLYGQVVRLPEAQPIHFLYYGEMLQRNGKCDLAREWYTKFAEAVPDDVRGQYANRTCDLEAELKAKGADVYEVKRTQFNSNLDDFGATFYKDGIVFASERDKGSSVKRNHCWTGQPFLDLYFVPIKNCGADATSGRPQKFNSDINSKYHDAIPTFTKDQSTIFFTRNNYLNGKSGADDQGIMRLKIYTAKQKGKGWGSDESLPFNSDEYSCAHPTVNEEGTKLYFASDMPGGFGGMDLYVSELENGRWGPPMNMGPNLNTEGNEIFPSIHKSGRLYFSSDGQLGLGGLDIYYVDQQEGGQAWSSPENIGSPVNSKDDDFGFTLSDEGTCGFLSSDRAGGSGRDDIYSFTKTATPIKIYVYDEDTKLPIEGAMVSSEACNKKGLKTRKDGRVSTDVKFNSCCTFTAEFPEYEPASKEGCVKDAASSENVVVEIPLKKMQKFKVDGFVFDQSTGLPLAESKVTLIACDSTKNQTFTTDASGKFTFKLDTGCCFKLRGEKEKYFAVTTPDTICTKGITESKTYEVKLNLQPTTVNPNNPTGTPNSGTPSGPIADGGTTGGGLNPDGTPKTGGTTGNALNPDGTPMKGGSTSVGKPGDISYVDTEVTYDPKKGLYMKNGKPFTGTSDGQKYKKGKPVGGKKSSNPDAVAYDQASGTYMKDGKPFTGKNNGTEYKDGQIVGGSGFQPAGTVHSDDPNSQAYLLHIYYDFDQSNIRDESKTDLDRLLKLMQDNPTYLVELASHTDARGSNSYNNRLSQRRAEAVVRWLVDKGVDRARLVPRGYGEGMTANRCKNAVPCTEQEHQMNRRTEFRVLGCTGCIDENKKKLSSPNENAKVDKCKGCPF
jgi:outer membrane protein OmpA-like peptidoglycan-associated protein